MLFFCFCFYSLQFSLDVIPDAQTLANHDLAGGDPGPGAIRDGWAFGESSPLDFIFSGSNSRAGDLLLLHMQSGRDVRASVFVHCFTFSGRLLVGLWFDWAIR